MASLKLYELPDNVLKNVLQQMETIELIELTFVSRRSKEKITEMEFSVENLTFNEDWISLEFEWKEKQFIFSFTNDTSQINGYRVIDNISYFWSTNPSENTISTVTKEVRKYMKAFDYFCELFKVKNYGCEVSKPFHKNKLIELPKKIKFMKLGEKMTKKEEISNVMKYFEIEESLDILGEIDCFHEKMLNVNTIYIDIASNLSIEEINRLNNKRIEIYEHKFSSEDMKIFLKNWKKNKTNLEYLKVNNESECIEMEEMLDGLNAKPFDPEGRDQYYELPDADVDCENYMDIERDFDGKLASVGIDGINLEVFVWDDPFPSKKWENVEEEEEEEEEENGEGEGDEMKDTVDALESLKVI
uniref:FBA_2 domain-containing protein n=2 Tax=Caenorhabditis tropicalis TaxID=1561998 RepID=A0A1I7U3M6_9PELO